MWFVVYFSAAALLLGWYLLRPRGKLFPLAKGPYVPLLGHTWAIILGKGNLTALLNGPWSRGSVVELHLSGPPTVLVNDPDLALTVLSGRDFDKGPAEGPFKILFRESLASVHDQDLWYTHRSLLRPIFSKKGLEPHVMDIHMILRHHLSAVARGVPVNASAMCRQSAFSVVWKVIFNAGDDTPSFRSALDALSQLNRDFVFADMDVNLNKNIASWLPQPNLQKCRAHLRTLHDLVEQNWLGTASDPSHQALAGVLGALHRGDSYDHSSLLDEAALLLFAGYDTTAVSMQHTLKILHDHPLIWAHMRELVLKHWNRECPLDFMKTDSENPLEKFLDAFVKESMRVEPAVALHVRFPVRKVELQGILLQEKQNIFINCSAITRNPQLWGEDASEFKPERWLDGGSASKVEKYWMPFGGGKRICLGSQLSLLEQKLFLVNLVDVFETISVQDRDSLHHMHGITNAYNKDMMIKFT